MLSPLPQNRAYSHWYTAQAIYVPKRRTDAMNLTVAGVMHQPEIREVFRAP